MKCARCNARMRTVALSVYGESFKARECTSCGRRIVSLEIAMRIAEKNIRPMDIKKKIIKVGDSSAITIPKEIRHHFMPGSEVSFFFEPKEMEIKIRKTL